VIFAPLALSLFVAACPARPTLWLVQPLAPGQDTVAARAEQALPSLMPQELRAQAVIGRAQLSRALSGKKLKPTCAFAEPACDPAEAVVSNLGFEWTVQVRAGEEAGGFRVRVLLREAGMPPVTSGDERDPDLSRALSHALSQVVPFPEVKLSTAPEGAVVSVDGRAWGRTPAPPRRLASGAHRLEVKAPEGYRAPEPLALEVPLCGAVSRTVTLEELPAQVQVSATPADARLLVDGQLVQGASLSLPPRAYVLRLERDGYLPHEESLRVERGRSYTVTAALEPVRDAGSPAPPDAGSPDSTHSASPDSTAGGAPSAPDAGTPGGAPDAG